jgi:hypothetical protein
MMRLLKTIFLTALALNIAMIGLFTSTASAAVPPNVTVQNAITQGVSTPARMAMDPAGNLYVADARAGGILKYDAAGNLLQVIATSKAAQGIALTQDGNLVVSEGDFVALLNKNGSELRKLGIGVGQFKMANGIAVNAAGSIYVVDSLDDCVQVFTAAGDFSFRFGAKGNTPGQFSLPTGISFEKIANHLAVADTMNGRIQFFDGNGVYQKSIGSYGSGPLKFTYLEGVAFEYSNGPSPSLTRMYAVDAFQSSLQVIDPTGSGTYLSTIGSYGSGAGRLMSPADVIFDQAGSRLIASSSNGRLALFSINQNQADTLPPDVSITGKPETTSIQKMGSFSFTSTDPAATFMCAVDAGAYAACTSPFVYNLAYGSHNFTVKSLDPAGNASTTPAAYSWNIVSSSTATLSVSLSGTGTGAINSNPQGIACSSNCTAPFTAGSTVTLFATPGATSIFSGWTGACSSSSGECSVVLGDSASVTATFLNVAVRIPAAPPIYFPSLQTAYASSSNGGTIQGVSADFTENIVFNRNISINLEGGYDSGYTSNNGMTTLHGTLTVGNGNITIENLVIE